MAGSRSDAIAPRPDALIERIARALEGTQPGPLETGLRNQVLPGDLPASLRDLSASPPRPAAVLVPIVAYDDAPRLLLTRRNDRLRHHAGQISFPGGALEAGDAGPVEAALRETREEIGLETAHIDILGYLDTYLTITRYAVTPVVAAVTPGHDLRPDPTEVAEIFEVPLAFVLDPANARQHTASREGIRVRYYSIPWQDRNIWGATAGMLMNLASKIS